MKHFTLFFTTAALLTATVCAGPKEFLAAFPKEAGSALAKVGNADMATAGAPEDLLREDPPVPKAAPDDPFAKYARDMIAARQAVEKALPQMQPRVKAVCDALGSMKSDWDMPAGPEIVAFRSVAKATSADLEGVLNGAKMPGDAARLRGAARLVFWAGVPPLSKESRLRYELPLAKVIIEGQEADKNLTWVFGRLAASPDEKVSAYLEQILGKLPDKVDRKDRVDADPSPRVQALLTLAKRKHPAAPTKAKEMLAKLPVTEETKPEIAGCEICLALAGDPAFIKQEHFALDSNVLGIAAIRAIENFKGRAGMDALVNGATKHGYAETREEAVLAFERLTGTKFYQGKEQERAEWHGKEVREWWAQHGSEFLEKAGAN